MNEKTSGNCLFKTGTTRLVDETRSPPEARTVTPQVSAPCPSTTTRLPARAAQQGELGLRRRHEIWTPPTAVRRLPPETITWGTLLTEAWPVITGPCLNRRPG